MKNLPKLSPSAMVSKWKPKFNLWVPTACAIIAPLLLVVEAKLHELISPEGAHFVSVIGALMVDALAGYLVGKGCEWAFDRDWKKLTLEDYPSTFAYCFLRKKEDGTEIRIIGFFSLEYEEELGIMKGTGASFDWEGTRVEGTILIAQSKVPWTSTHIGSNGGFAYIIYEVAEPYRDLRNYSHGLLQFKELQKTKGPGGGNVYVGHMQSIDPPDHPDRPCKAPIFSRAYAVEIRGGGNLSEDKIKEFLTTNAFLIYEEFRSHFHL